MVQFRKSLLQCAALMAFSSVGLTAAEMASASITYTQIDPVTYHYDLTLDDTGTTNIGTFWFSWIPGQDFMQATPVNILAPASWTDSITGSGVADGRAIRWVAGAGVALTPGESVSGFGFDSTVTPAQLDGLSPTHPTQPELTSVVYSAGPFSDAGFQFTAQQPTAAPEPSTWILFGTAIFGLAMTCRRTRATADNN